MKKMVLFLASLLPFFTIQTASYQKNTKSLPDSNLLTLENKTGHKIFIVEGKCFKQIEPMQAVTLGWKKPLHKYEPRAIAIYYGGTIEDTNPPFAMKKRKHHATGSGPRYIAQLKTNKPGTVSFYYNHDGVLKMTHA